MAIIKPLIKWIGGKTQILDKVLENIPNEMTNYHEPFIGGGSVLLGVLSTKKIIGRAYAYDANRDLINFYRHVRDRPNELYLHIEEFMTNYNDVCPDGEKGENERSPQTEEEALASKETYYYWMRKVYNQEDGPSIKKSSLFLILNKLCFRGVYREGPHGFNVPFGHYKNPTAINKEHLDEVSALLKGVKFRCKDFRGSLAKVVEGDFVYLDPPYAPECAKSFVGYQRDGFGEADHTELFELTKKLGNFTMSNANVLIVREAFDGYKTAEVSARRAIHSKDPSVTTTEVIITTL